MQPDPAENESQETGINVLLGEDGGKNRAGPIARERGRRQNRMRAVAPYGLAFAGVIAATAMTGVLLRLNAHVVAPFFYLGVIVTAIYGNVRAAALAIALSLLSLDYFFITPHEPFSVTRGDVYAAVLFSVVGSVIVLLIGKLRANQRNLRASEERYRDLVENSREFICTHDLDGLILSANRAAIEVLDYDPKDYVGKKNFRDVLAPEVSDQFDDYLARIRRDGVASGVMLVQTSTGERRLWEYYNTLRTEGVATPIVRGIARDITERKRAEEASRQSERAQHRLALQLEQEKTRLLEAQGVAKVGSWENDFATQRGTWSTETYRIFERESEFQPTHPAFVEMVHPEDRAAVRTAMADSVAGRGPSETEYRIFLPDGRIKFVAERWKIFRDEQGTPVRAVGTCQDITERRQAEEALRESEERFRQLTENIDEIFMLRDVGSTRTIYMSPAYEKIWGRSCESLYSEPDSWKEAIHPGDRNYVEKILANPKLETKRNLTFRIVRPDGALRWVWVRGFPVRDGSGKVTRVAGIIQDVTEQEQMTQKLRLLSRRVFKVQEDEKRHLARELHDQMAQSLTAAKMSLQSAEQMEGGAAIAQKLQDSIAIIDRLFQQVRKLSLDLRSPLLDDLGLVPALRSYLDEQAQRSGFSVEFLTDGAMEQMSSEIETACFRIVQEAVTNTVRHAQAKKVSLELRRTPEGLRLIVREDGRGFNVPATIEHAEQGGGLGLLGMRERVALLGGSLDLQSEPGHGTKLDAFLPIPSSLNSSGAKP
ncbi:MAG: hypothetical protein DLM73_04115 [Chthoniobacterales bacterium]|nr:MAG: hypothetical protein DLM73_04115 [Chthoniobacterales bacterium]